MISFDSGKTYRTCLLTFFASLLISCAPRAPEETSSNLGLIPANFPDAYYRQAKVLGKEVLRVNRSQSLITIEVHRGGVLARLGHDHVIASRDIQGYIIPEDGQADLYLPLKRLTVDEVQLRADAAQTTTPSPDAIEGTRRNMLDKVLEEERFPWAFIHIVRKDMTPSLLHVSITLHGTTHTFDIPAQVDATTNGIIVTGKMSMNQSDFGIVPFTILGGALQVRNQLDLHFRIVADKI